MNQESTFTNLPPQIIINILSRLPIKPIITCKLVCKPWLELLETREFSDSHLSKSTPGLVVLQSLRDTSSLKIFDLKDEPDLEHHDLHYDLVTEIDRDLFTTPSNRNIMIVGSAKGLIFFRDMSRLSRVHYICNPITRECAEIPDPDGISHFYPTVITYGFGASKTTGQHKVVRILHECVYNDKLAFPDIPLSECRVYTLGTGSWRKIEHGSKMLYNCLSVGAFLNGSLHWLVMDLKFSSWISCFDLETESFSSFLLPDGIRGSRFLGDLFVLGDCLCICDNTSEVEIVIWIMKEYGVEMSWTKEYVISKCPDFSGESYDVVRPMKVFADGDMLMSSGRDVYLFYYSDKAKTTMYLDMFSPRGWVCNDSTLLTFSFRSLKDFDMENVRPF